MAEIEKNGKPEGVNVTKAVITQEPVQETENLHLKTRRRLIQVGLMSLPVLMTVRSRPAFAQSLGSVEIPYGAYLTDVDGNPTGTPIKVDADGNLVLKAPNGTEYVADPNDVLTIQQIRDQQIMVEPDRRDEDGTRNDDTVRYQATW